MTEKPAFTPALGRPELTNQYDRVVGLMTRERRWRARLLDALAPGPDDVVVDLGAGTGSMALLIKAAQPRCRVIAVDPDPDVLAIARQKAQAAGQHIEFVQAYGEAPGLPAGGADKVISSLVLHQCSQAAKEGLLAAAFDLLRPGGQLLIADYGWQRTALMDMLFRQVRMLDGFENTRANKDGEIPGIIEGAGFAAVTELSVTATPTGSISIYAGMKPGG